MLRIFVPTGNIHNGSIDITDAGQLHHIRDVLRVKPGREMLVFDDLGAEYQAKLENISAKSARLSVSKMILDKEDQFDLTVAVAIPRKAKFDDIVNMLTQLGVRRIIPMVTGRTIVRLEGERAAARQARWEKIALNACEQSQRRSLPEIDAPSTIAKVVKESDGFQLKIVPALIGKNIALKDALKAARGAKSMIVLIGPEGDFTPAEIGLCRRAGFIPVTLGKRVLRVDTAAVAVAAYIMLNNA